MCKEDTSKIMLENISNAVEDFKIEPSMLYKGNCFISLDGVDCSGKGSITKIIEEKGIDGVKVKRVDFPQYDLPSGEMIKSFLNGEGIYGNYLKYMNSVPYEGLSPMEWHAVVSGRSENLYKMIEFVSHLYSINRVEYFMRNEIEPGTVYIFDRYQYSNVIHQFSNISSYFCEGDGSELLAIRWRASKEHEDVTYEEFVMDRVYGDIKKMYDKMLRYERKYGVYDTFKFLLLITENEVRERLEKRKDSKHEGRDILEENDAIHRACKFVNLKNSDFHMINGCVPISVDEFKYDNDKIAEFIVNSYKFAIENNFTSDDNDLPGLVIPMALNGIDCGCVEDCECGDCEQ